MVAAVHSVGSTGGDRQIKAGLESIALAAEATGLVWGVTLTDLLGFAVTRYPVIEHLIINLILLTELLLSQATLEPAFHQWKHLSLRFYLCHCFFLSEATMASYLKPRLFGRMHTRRY